MPNPQLVLNPNTGRMVRKNGKIGQELRDKQKKMPKTMNTKKTKKAAKQVKRAPSSDDESDEDTSYSEEETTSDDDSETSDVSESSESYDSQTSTSDTEDSDDETMSEEAMSDHTEDEYEVVKKKRIRKVQRPDNLNLSHKHAPFFAHTAAPTPTITPPVHTTAVKPENFDVESQNTSISDDNTHRTISLTGAIVSTDRKARKKKR